MSDPCPIETVNGIAGWCSRHQRYHAGHVLKYATGMDESSIQRRLAWDALLEKFEHKAILRTLGAAQKCISLGPLLDKTKCGSEVWACGIHGTCSQQEHRCGNMALCQACEDWSETAVDLPAGPRHLLYHLWPRKMSLGVWQRNLDHLKQRWELFDGKRVIAVVTDGQTHDLAAVQAYMKGFACEWLHFENDPKLREVLTFEPLFSRVEGLPGFTFYGQAKGVTKGINPGVSVHGWTQAMCETLLDYWPRVHKLLKNYPVVGSFKKAGIAAFGESRSNWHYSGSFCWLRNADLWRKNWREIDRHWFGIETWPSLHFSDEQAGVSFFEQTKQFDLYQADYWQSVEGKLKAWRRSMGKYRSGTGSSTTGSSL